ncbi:MAG TPA: acetyl-CoA C-acyltransferase [Candidatus Dormibacteraeota bacterium]|nr:acetyl-CoA C-acyltransferase [Candidatus Dormibacteraeota bacterium]
MAKTVILSAARTPFGRLGGALSSLPATTLGGEAIRGAIERAGIDPGLVDHVLMGEVLQAGVGQAPARQASFKAGLAKTVTSETINKVCASGMVALAISRLLIESGQKDVIVAGGMESMSNAPYLLEKARFGYRYGDGQLVDAMVRDGLWDYFFNVTMAYQGAQVAAELELSREEQDRWALRSHNRASAATTSGAYGAEMLTLKVGQKAAAGKLVVDRVPQQQKPRVPVHAGGNGGGASVWDHVPPESMVASPEVYSPYVTGEVPFAAVDADEAIRHDANLEAMAKLKPLDKGGSVTAGNAPGVNDGAAALVLTSDAWARSHGVEPLAEILGHADAGWDPPYLALTPAMASQKLLDKLGLKASQIDLWEINEAFASVTLSSLRKLGIDEEKVNAQGGAIALGHPIGASGARIVTTLVHQLRARGGGIGIAAICSGSAQGDAIAVRVG